MLFLVYYDITGLYSFLCYKLNSCNKYRRNGLISFQLLPGDLSPVNPYATVFPLVLVLSLTAAKEAVEDWKRYKFDKYPTL